jgi:outer membrane receptor protein involved in Fe transport
VPHQSCRPGIGYGLNLFSDLTYLLDDPVNGDQFEQGDRRIVAGGRATQQWSSTLFGCSIENLAGIDVRHDHIGNVGLYYTRDREVLDTIRADKVLQTSAGVFAQSTIQWSEKLRTVTGLRADSDRVDVHAGDPANGGTATASIASPKFSLILGPWSNTEVYPSAGSGFHSNDGRGTTLTRDPASGEPLIASTRSSGPKARRSACARMPCRGCKARSHCGGSI